MSVGPAGGRVYRTGMSERCTDGQRGDVPITITWAKAMAIAAKLEVGAQALERQGNAVAAQLLRSHAEDLAALTRRAGKLRAVPADD